MKIITVYCTSKQDRRKELVDLCLGMIQPSRAEHGCIVYDFLQDMTDSHRFLFYEEWEDQESIDRHNVSRHFIEFQSKFQELLASPAVITVRSAETE